MQGDQQVLEMQIVFSTRITLLLFTAWSELEMIFSKHVLEVLIFHEYNDQKLQPGGRLTFPFSFV